MARRALGRQGGVAAVDMLTLYRLAELIGSPALVADGRSPVSTAVVDLAIRRVLAECAGVVRAGRRTSVDRRRPARPASRAPPRRSRRRRRAHHVVAPRSRGRTRQPAHDTTAAGRLVRRGRPARAGRARHRAGGAPTARPHDRVPASATARTGTARAANTRTGGRRTGHPRSHRRRGGGCRTGHDRSGAPARLVGAEVVGRHHSTGAAVRRRGDLHHRRRRRGPARRPSGARRRPRRNAVRSDGPAVVGGATVRTTCRAPPRGRRDRVERPARYASRRAPRAATRHRPARRRPARAAPPRSVRPPRRRARPRRRR